MCLSLVFTIFSIAFSILINEIPARKAAWRKKFLITSLFVPGLSGLLIRQRQSECRLSLSLSLAFLFIIFHYLLWRLPLSLKDALMSFKSIVVVVVVLLLLAPRCLTK